MFYTVLWLTMFIGWMALIIWGASMESRDRRRARMPAAAPKIAVVVEEEPEPTRHVVRHA